MTVQQPSPASSETISALTRTVDEAVGLLRTGRYADLDVPFSRLERQAKDLESVKRALEGGAPAEPGLRRLCERLGNSLFVFSEVAQQVAAVEAGMVELIAGPRDGSYDRGGQCDNAAGARFRQEA
jgi:hypothetical protein